MRKIYAVIGKTSDGRLRRKWIELAARKCEMCEKSFDPHRQESRYCSNECSKQSEQKRHIESYRKRAREYYLEHKDKISKKRKILYWNNPEYWRKKAREWSRENHRRKRRVDNAYKDQTRHGGKRNELIKKNGIVCSGCGKKGTRFQIVTHHTTLDKNNHQFQKMLCRSCHMKIHVPFKKKINLKGG